MNGGESEIGAGLTQPAAAANNEFFLLQRVLIDSRASTLTTPTSSSNRGHSSNAEQTNTRLARSHKHTTTLPNMDSTMDLLLTKTTAKAQFPSNPTTSKSVQIQIY